MREIILVRHGQAASLSTTDSERELTARGKDQAQKTATFIQAHFKPAVLWSSTYRRAQQTAAFIGEAIGMQHQASADFTPHGEVARAHRRLLDSDAQTLILVSHLPLLPSLVGALLCTPVHINVATADIVHLTLLGGEQAYLTGMVPNAWLT